ANAQPLAQHDYDASPGTYFYLHDRLGSVRLMIDTTAAVEKSYTYNPFGEILESEETDSDMKNPFLFAGQWLDSEISQYYLRARMYDPYISRFTSRDPISGKYESPLTLHKYLYCQNEPVNRIDLSGLDAYLIFYPCGGPESSGLEDAGHVDIGVDMPDGRIMVNTAAWGTVKTPRFFDNLNAASYKGKAIVIRFKTKDVGETDSDLLMIDYIQNSGQPSHPYPYCSWYASEGLRYADYALGRMDNVSPRDLLLAASRRSTSDDNIVLDKDSIWVVLENRIGGIAGRNLAINSFEPEDW
ncbi:MAG: RHS repeat domain-containing protein, partial [Planctomycetota bacterium]